MAGITLDVLGSKVDGINQRLDKINGTNQKQWDEISKLNIKMVSIQSRCDFDSKKIEAIEVNIKEIPDVNSSMWKFALWTGAMITLLNIGTTLIMKSVF